MSIITVTDFNTFTGANTDNPSQSQIFIDSAESILKLYLGFDPSSQIYTETIDGYASQSIQVSAKPITLITSITIDSISQAVVNFYSDDENIAYKQNVKVFTSGIQNIVINYTAGYTIVPPVMKSTILRIAGLLYSESNGSIGVTSKSFDNGSTRTFFKTTNFDPYLNPLQPYRLYKLMLV